MSLRDDLTPEERDQALRAAKGHVFHAMDWMEKYSKHGRDKCAKCERAWKAGDPSKRGES